MYYGKLHFLECGKITARGWLRDQLLRSRDGMGGHLYELEPQMLWDPYVHKTSYPGWGAPAAWGSEIAGNYWYGFIALAFALPDEDMQKKAEEWVELTLANQEEDGYLGAYSKQDNRAEDYNAWGNACGMRALMLYAEATGRQDVFDAVYRGLLWFCRTDEWHFTRYGGHLILKLMAYFYRRTGDRELLDFCNAYEAWLNELENDGFRVSMKSLGEDAFFYNQNHGVCGSIFVSRPASEYLADGDEEKLRVSIKGLEKLHEKCMMVNGAISGTSEWLSPKSSTAEMETCVATACNGSYGTLAAATGKAIYGDYMEKVVFNAAQGARKKDERAVTYYTAPNQLCATDHSAQAHDPHGLFAPAHPTACCAVNSVVILPEFVKNAAMADGAGNLYILAYAPIAIRHQNALIEVDTLYPFREELTLKITSLDGKPVCFSIFLKQPNWCRDMLISAPGKKIAPVNDDGFVKVSGPFENGEEIQVTVKMEASVVEMDDTDGADKHPLSVLYGPLCFCLPVEEIWINKGDRYAATPLPEGWAWWEVQKPNRVPASESWLHRLDPHACNFAATRESLEEELTVIQEEITGYVWENPPLSIYVNGWQAPFLYSNYPPAPMSPMARRYPLASGGG